MNVQLIDPQPDALTGEYVVVVHGQGIAYHGDDRRQALCAYFYHALLDENVELKARTDVIRGPEKTA